MYNFLSILVPLGLSQRLLAFIFGIPALVLVVALSGLLTFRQMTTTNMLREERVALPLYLDGTVHKPFAHRVLVPLGIRLLSQVLPESVLSSIEHWLAPVGMRSLGFLAPERQKQLRLEGRPIHYYFLAGLLGSSLLAYTAISYLLYCQLFESVWWYRMLIPVLVLAVLIPFVSNGVGHIYDFTVLMFMSALLYAIVTHRHWLFIVVFAVSCINKETTILMAIAYASYFRDRLPRPRFLRYIGIQWVTFAVIYSYVRFHFQANQGMTMEHWWGEQIKWFTSRTFQDFATFLVIITLITFCWQEKPLVLRRAAAMLIPHLCLFLIGAYAGEIRNFYESLPLLTLFACRNLQLFSRYLFSGPIGGRQRTA